MLAGIERLRYRAWRVLPERFKEAHDATHPLINLRHVIDDPVPVCIGSDIRALKGVLHKVIQLRQAQEGERLSPHAHCSFQSLLGEGALIVADAHAHKQAVVVGVEEGFASAFDAVVSVCGALE